MRHESHQWFPDDLASQGVRSSSRLGGILNNLARHDQQGRMSGMTEEVLVLGRLETDRMTFEPATLDLRARYRKPQCGFVEGERKAGQANAGLMSRVNEWRERRGSNP